LAAAWRFARQPRERRRVVFYVESAADWPHLSGILRRLVDTHGQPVSVLATAADDPVFQLESALVSAFHIGEGHARTILFRALDADLVVMTMPDLGVFHLKRSIHPVHYVYVFHAINSTHMIYRADSFDAYDTVLCVGPHHSREIRARENRYGVRAKHLVDHGSTRLDALLLATQDVRPSATDPVILVAPSWGASSLIEHNGQAVIKALLDGGYRVRLRPHPMQWRMASPALLAILAAFDGVSRFELDTAAHADRSFCEAGLLVSDWSGAALEFGLSTGRPVLFIDTPRKVRNPPYAALGLEPVEVGIRERLGRVLEPQAAVDTPSVARELLSLKTAEPAGLARLRDEVVFNVGKSAAVGADTILEVLAGAGQARAT